MKNTNDFRLFSHYFEITDGGFYTTEEEGRIMKLLAFCAGYTTEQTKDLIQVITKMREEDLSDFVSCQNALLRDRLLEDTCELRHAALVAYCKRNNRKSEYPNRAVWQRHIIEHGSPLMRGFYEYATGRLPNAVSAFEAVRRESGCDLPLCEILAKISLENNRPDMAYEYALRAQWINADTKIDVPAAATVEEAAIKEIAFEGREKIKARALHSGQCGKIGFIR